MYRYLFRAFFRLLVILIYIGTLVLFCISLCVLLLNDKKKAKKLLPLIFLTFTKHAQHRPPGVMNRPFPELPSASVSNRVQVRNLSYENDYDLDSNGLVSKTHFHMKGFALGLVLKQRQKTTRKWPITKCPIFKRKHCINLKRLQPFYVTDASIAAYVEIWQQH